MKIQQFLRDNAGREKRPVNMIRNGADASLYIYDVIDSYWGVSALAVISQIASASDADVLHVYINSPGGDVFEGRAIMAAIGRFQGKTIAHIDSLCASAATSVALACDEVEISDGAFFMIHNASAWAYGDKNDMRSTADLLEKVEGSIVGDYAAKTGKDVDQINAWMNAETWFDAAEALEAGFVNRIVPAPSAVKNMWNLGAFNNAPSALAPVAVVVPPVPPVPEVSNDHRERQQQRLQVMNRLTPQ